MELSKMSVSKEKGTVIPLSETVSIADAERAAKQVQEEIVKQQEHVKELQSYNDENKDLSKLILDLPDSVSHKIMVPFGKAAFFPGRLIHTNEFLVLLGEGYYAERSSKQAAEILERRSGFLQSKIANVQSQIADLEAEASFAINTAAEAKAGVVEIREQVTEATADVIDQDYSAVETTTDASDQVRGTTQGDGSTVPSGIDNLSSMTEDEEHNRLMARIEALEAAEKAAGDMSDEEELSDEEGNGEEDEFHAMEAIPDQKSFLTKDQKATLLDKLQRSELDDYVSDDSEEEDYSTGAYDEDYEDETDEGDRMSHPLSADQGRSAQVQNSSVGQAEGSRKQRPLSRFAREVHSVKERANSERHQLPVASQIPEVIERVTSFEGEKDASCSGLEVPDMRGFEELEKLKEWRTQESNKQGFVLGKEARKKPTTDLTNSERKREQKIGSPTRGQTQAFSGRVTEHNTTPITQSSAGGVTERTGPSTSIGASVLSEQTAMAINQSDTQSSKPVSKFRQMRQAGGR